MLSAIINKLDRAELDGAKLFIKVESAIDLAVAMKSPLRTGRVAYVFEVSRQPGANSRLSGRPSQNVKTTIGVVIGISVRNDINGSKAKDITTRVLEQTRKTLYGFIPTSDNTALILGNADTIGFSDGVLWKLERFSTEHIEEP